MKKKRVTAHKKGLELTQAPQQRLSNITHLRHLQGENACLVVHGRLGERPEGF